MTMNQQVNEILQIPAIKLPLQGRHLIEASAGTGKTWTLTGVVLRLLVEAGYPCNKIIATTFTRSASAEMRQRIRERLQDFYQLLMIVNATPVADVIQQNDTTEKKVANFMTWLAKQCEQHQLSEKYQDPINQYLISYIAKQVLINHEEQTYKKRQIIDFYVALQRVKTAINQLDQLFVGTLDSLCQKWLREFGNETGYSPNVQISNDVSTSIKAMVHDQLRIFWAKIYQQQPEIYHCLKSNDKLLNMNICIDAVEKAFNFYTTPIDKVDITPINIQQIVDLMEKISHYQDDEFSLYFDKAYRENQGFVKNSTLNTRFEYFVEFQQYLANADLKTIVDLPKNYQELMQAIYEAITNEKGLKKVFNRDFLTFSVLQDIHHLYQLSQQISQYLIDLKSDFIQFICNHVRHNLPKLLETQNLTTFTLQLARLNQVLSGEQGEMLARYIRHQYPVALIDESQDINTEQALLIQRIYLTDDDSQVDKNRNQKLFLLLVGDPKQAIYGFRGGDVQNYTALKKMFPNKPLQLLENRRSSQDLIHAINAWYGVNHQPNASDEMIKELPSYLGEEIFYQKIVATRTNADLALVNQQKTLPTFYHLNLKYQQVNPHSQADDNDYLSFDDVIVGQILALFDPNSTEKLQLNGQNLTLSDICILCSSHSDLDKVEKKLHESGIPTIRGGSQSIFADNMSKNLLVLMAVLLNPYHKSKLKTLLMSDFFQLTLDESNQLLENSKNDKNLIELLDEIQQILVLAHEKWQKNNFLSAMQWLFNQQLTLFQQPKQNFWQRLASHHHGERLLIDLRQLLDIIAEYDSGQTLGEYQMYDWYYSQVQNPSKDEWALQQRLPSDVGVELMTIHASKGLEFAIVFVVGLDRKIEDKKKILFLYSKNQPALGLKNRGLSAVEQDKLNEQNFAEMQLQSLYEEKLRLLYVALTRAKERIYLVTVGKKSSSKTALKPFVEDDKTFELKENIKECVSVVDINSLSNFFKKESKIPNEYIKKMELLSNNDEKTYQEKIDKITHKYFKGVDSSSFTGLKKYYVQDVQQNIAIDIDEQIKEDETSDDISQPIDETLAMRFRFERGEKAGTFLHKVLEDLLSEDVFFDKQNLMNFQEPPKSWSRVVNQSLQTQKLPEKYFSTDPNHRENKQLQVDYLQLTQWINEIIHTPLLASGQRLLDIKSQPKVAELGFKMRLSPDFSIIKLNQLFRKYDIPLFLQENKSTLLNYLTGEIDLVYQHNHRFYVVDYKSNYLGDTLQDYSQNAMYQTMTKESYWLQASIYQVALHRFLGVRLQNYDMNENLGQVEYVFLRGMSPENSANYGRILCDFPIDLIIELDELFGKI